MEIRVRVLRENFRYQCWLQVCWARHKLNIVARYTISEKIRMDDGVDTDSIG